MAPAVTVSLLHHLPGMCFAPQRVFLHSKGDEQKEYDVPRGMRPCWVNVNTRGKIDEKASHRFNRSGGIGRLRIR